MSHVVVGLGEVLWDMFPDERLLGGAPANVAYHAAVLGNNGVVASRIGNDELGRELAGQLDLKSCDTSHIQTDPTHPTGTVQVTFVDGDPRYEIVLDTAWDFLEWTNDWEALAKQSAAVCFSTLAQRNPESRNTIEQFLTATKADCLRVLDINLRPPFVNEEILKTSIEQATVVKYNYQESLFLKRLFWKDDFERWLCHDAEVHVVCVTRGPDGSDIYTRNHHASVPAETVDTSEGDPVGAGDAFSAALIDGLLRDLPIEEVAARANRYAGIVASMKGGMPQMPPLSELGL